MIPTRPLISGGHQRQGEPKECVGDPSHSAGTSPTKTYSKVQVTVQHVPHRPRNITVCMDSHMCILHDSYYIVRCIQ